MRITYVSYMSKNGIRFHHTKSVFDSDYSSEHVNAETHTMCEICLLLSGSVTYIIDGKTYPLSAMETIIIAPGELHSVRVDTSKPYERMVLRFSPDLLPSFNDLDLFRPFSTAKAYEHLIPKTFVEKYDIFSHMTKCKQICTEKGKYLDLNLVSAIINITKTMNDILEKITNLKEYPAFDSMLDDKSISSICIKYISSHISDRLSAEDIAKALNISISHLQHTFKKEMGITLRTYVLRHKMNLAKHLLSKGKAAQAVAMELGYDCYSTFYLNFMKCFSYSPNDVGHRNKQLYGTEIDKENYI